MPGGLGVRELVLQHALIRQFAASQDESAAAGLAVVVALVLRLVWTIAELVLGLVLWMRRGRRLDDGRLAASRRLVGWVERVFERGPPAPPEAFGVAMVGLAKPRPTLLELPA